MEPSASPPWYIDSPAPETTRVLAALLGRSIGARGLAIGLVGPLGSGKTVFVKGLAEGLGVDPRTVSSPTFVIAQEYALPEGPERLHHLDFYRLTSESELESIGFLDLLGPGQVLAVEWLDRFPAALGPDRLEVVFLPASEASGGEPEDASDGKRPSAKAEAATPGDREIDGAARRIRVTAYGDEPARVLRDWASRWARITRGAAAPERGRDPLGRADLKLLAALLAAGWIGLAGLAVGPNDGAERDAGCTVLAPEAAGGGLYGNGRDELGPLRVRCVEGELPSGTVASDGLEGMARLLDGGRLDPNEAPRRLLESLPGIGPGRAAAIEAERAQAPFRATSDLERVPGIGPKTREQLDPYLAVDSWETPG